MNDSLNTLHFTFGPVQDFVAQARRTRDLWGGSYLLSYLAGHAMQAVLNEKGTIVFPSVKNDPMIRALPDGASKPGIDDQAAQVGSLPNRFKAQVHGKADGSVCSKALQDAWKRIANAVFQTISPGGILEADPIWKRQINGAWDCTWVIGEEDNLIELRKHLRTHFPAAEGGEKCTVCGERQEISGKGMGTSKSRDDMRQWWSDLRRRMSHLDLRETERLCAVCITKRLFPRVAHSAIDWKVPTGFPSTSYMAAADWIRRVLRECKDSPEVRGAVGEFLATATDADVGYSEANTRISGISEALAPSGLEASQYRFADLDGAAFFEASIRNMKEFPLKGDDAKDQETPREKLIAALKKLQKTLPEKRGEPREATPFYALLLMDGDGMGKLLSKYRDNQSDISFALADFTKAVPARVRACDGRLIYAGGDDVFALLPLDQAIKCAQSCREAYQDAFGRLASFVPKEEATISAAIEYAHIHTALGVVVRDAHRLLDDIAKEKTGRDAIACRVWKRGGPVLTWSMPWESALKVTDGKGGTIVDEVQRRFQNAQGDSAQFSSKFFYKTRDLFSLLDGAATSVLGEQKDKQQQLELRLLTAEYLATRDLRWPPKPDGSKWTEAEKRRAAEARVERLLALCRESTRKIDAAGQVTYTTGNIDADGAFLVRFLAQKEV